MPDYKKEQELRGNLEKIAWKHYNPGSSINVEEMLDEMMPIILSSNKRIAQKVVEEVRVWVEKERAKDSTLITIENAPKVFEAIRNNKTLDSLLSFLNTLQD